MTAERSDGGVPEEFEQHYPAPSEQPVQVWVFCRLCRCRIQVRTVPTPALPFRCFCGYAGTLAKFDVFAAEEAARRFAGTFEQIYQATKELMQEAEMPLTRTARYSPEEVARFRAHVASVTDSVEEEVPLRLPGEDAASFGQAVRRFGDLINRARDVLARHEALSSLGVFAFARRAAVPEARRVCYQACEADLQIAGAVLAEATRRHRAGEPVALKFALIKRLVMLLTEDKQLPRALDVAVRGAQLGLPGYEERIQMLRAEIAKQGGR